MRPTRARRSCIELSALGLWEGGSITPCSAERPGSWSHSSGSRLAGRISSSSPPVRRSARADRRCSLARGGELGQAGHDGLQLGVVRDALEVVARRVGRLERADLIVVELDIERGNRLVDLLDRAAADERSEEHTSELQSPCNLVCRLMLEKKK